MSDSASEIQGAVAGQVVAVHAKSVHAFSKEALAAIELDAGLGVRGDAHAGVTVKHRSRVARDPSQPNLRQVHLLAAELLDELAGRGLPVQPGQMGENITTRGIDLLALSEGAELQIGPSARLRITGLRNPCAQIEAFMPGLLAAVLDRSPDGELIRRAGVMAVVLASGPVCPQDTIRWVRRPAPHQSLRPV